MPATRRVCQCPGCRHSSAWQCAVESPLLAATCAVHSGLRVALVATARWCTRLSHSARVHASLIPHTPLSFRIPHTPLSFRTTRRLGTSHEPEPGLTQQATPYVSSSSPLPSLYVPSRPWTVAVTVWRRRQKLAPSTILLARGETPSHIRHRYSLCTQASEGTTSGDRTVGTVCV